MWRFSALGKRDDTIVRDFDAGRWLPYLAAQPW